MVGLARGTAEGGGTGIPAARVLQPPPAPEPSDLRGRPHPSGLAAVGHTTLAFENM